MICESTRALLAAGSLLVLACSTARAETVIRWEAEDIGGEGLRRENLTFASNGAIVNLKGPADVGFIDAQFTDSDGTWDVVVVYHDENDGEAQLGVSIAGTPIDSWVLDRRIPGARQAEEFNRFTRKVANGIAIKYGDYVRVDARQGNWDHANIDYIEFTRVGDRFVDNGDGTISDLATGLMWEKKLPADGTEGGNCQAVEQGSRDARCVNNDYSWTSPIDGDLTNMDGTLFTDFLARLNQDLVSNEDETGGCFAGYCDWRVPRESELGSLLLSNGDGDRVINDIFGPTQVGGYWTRTTSIAPGWMDTGPRESAIVIEFYFLGHTGSWPKSESVAARSVRNLDRLRGNQ